MTLLAALFFHFVFLALVTFATFAEYMPQRALQGKSSRTSAADVQQAGAGSSPAHTSVRSGP